MTDTEGETMGTSESIIEELRKCADEWFNRSDDNEVQEFASDIYAIAENHETHLDGRDENKSVTWALRCYAHNSIDADVSHTGMVAIDTIANNIDARFDRELTAKQDEIDGLMADKADLQAKLDAAILPPVDADGAPWTDDDVDKPFLFAEDAECKTLREIAITWWGRSWCLVDDYDTHYPAGKCHHIASEPPESIEDVRHTVGRGYTYRDQDVLCAIDRAYACGKRDGAGERA